MLFALPLLLICPVILSLRSKIRVYDESLAILDSGGTFIFDLSDIRNVYAVIRKHNAFDLDETKPLFRAPRRCDNAVLYARVNDPEKAIIAVQDYSQATYQAALTTLRTVIGQHVLDEMLKDRDKISKAVQKIVDQITDPWGVKVEMVEMKDVEIPEMMQRAMAKEAEAIREKRARLIKAEAELQASEKLSLAAKGIAANPAALELRRMQMVTEVGVEHNTTTIILLPSDFVTLAKEIGNKLSGSQNQKNT